MVRCSRLLFVSSAHTLPVLSIMSDANAELDPAPKADVENTREPQPPSSSQQSSPSPQPSSPASTSKAVTDKEPSEDATSRRKREREGSLEPSQLTPSRAAEAIPTKKNRLEDSLQEEDDDDTVNHAAETEKVGQIRKKVDELSTKELELKSAESAPVPSSSTSEVDETVQDAASKTAQGPAETTESQTKFALAQPTKASQQPPARTQPTFSSFSSKSSPFSSVPSSSGSSSATTSRGGFSAFSAKSSSPLAGAGIKPSSLGSSIGVHHEENGSVSPLVSVSSKPIVKGSTFGFGAFAGASPLAKPKAASPTVSEKDSDKSQSVDDRASFTEKLLNHDKDTVAASETRTKPLLEPTEVECKWFTLRPIPVLRSCSSSLTT